MPPWRLQLPAPSFRHVVVTGIPLDAQDLAVALRGQYDILREVGRGGMGVVYLARDVRLDRAVAIKTLPSHLAADDVVRERFLREARTAASLSHPSIVPVHRADEIDRHVFFVMGFVDGPPLSQLVREGGPLTPRTTVAILHDVAAALAYAHGTGVVHRDVKAENILIDRETGRAMVTDFGIARLAEAAPLTATGTVLGTVHYMSPEQVAGEAVDARTDIYALGVVAFFALSGRVPFEGPTASAVLVAHVTKQAPSLLSVADSVPPEFGRLVDRCLEKDPAGRFQSCAEFVEALERVEARLPESDVAAPRPGAAAMAISSSEAEEVWRRAAELQHAGGPLPPLPPAPGRGAGSHDEPLTSGYRVEQVREAAREAGIGTQFVDRALVERGIAAATSPGEAPLVVREPVLPPPNIFLGSRTFIGWEVVVPGEMPERDFDLLVGIIQRALNDSGTVSTVGRSLSWASTDQRKVGVTVLVRDGRTTIHVGERLKELAGGVFGGIMGGAGGPGLGIAIPIAVGALAQPLLIPFMAVGIAGTAYGVARYTFRRISRTRGNALRELTERLAEQARDSIARRTVAPGRANERKLLR